MGTPTEARPDLCVIGTDPAGIEIALAAAALGVPTFLVTDAPENDAPPDAAFALTLQRLRAIGVRVIEARAAFTDKDRLAAGDGLIRARRYVIAARSSPRLPEIDGIVLPPLWDGVGAPQHLLVLGGGSEGVARAQAARRAGIRVTLIAEGALLADVDAEIAAILRAYLERQGIALREHVPLASGTIAPDERDGFTLTFSDGPGPLAFTHLALASGETPVLDHLGLAKAGIALAGGRPVVGANLRTTNRRIHAVGAASGLGSHHMRAEVGAVLAGVLFRKSVKLDPMHLSRLTLTRPGIAEIGLRERDIPQGRLSRYRFYRASLTETGRGAAQENGVAKSEPAGQIKVITTPDGRLQGASILADDAAELIVPLALAMTEGVPLTRLASLPIGAPSHAEALGALARQALGERLRTPGSRRLMRFLRLFG